MKIHYNDLGTNNIITNPLKNIHLINKKYASDQNDKNNISATINISEDAVNKYFDEGAFNKISDNMESNKLYTTNGIIKEYGKKYAEVYNKIMDNAPENKRTAYLDKLDSAFQKAVGDECNRMFNKIKKCFSNSDMECSLDKESFSDLFSKIANATKDYFVDGSKLQLDTYISNKIGTMDLGDFKTYNTFTKAIDMFDYTNKISDKMKKLRDMLIQNSPDDIISSSDLMNRILSYTNEINNDIDKLNELKNSINTDEMSDKFGKDFMKLMDKKTSEFSDINSKMQKYAELLKKYNKIQKRIDKANAKRETLNQKLDKANETKNQDLVSMYLKRVESYDIKIAKLEAKSAQIQSEMASLLKDIKESKI
ncbi:hypothetical protein [Vallitalea sp.]|uniref:hypothetical protein n=1 Tax=Vallitalea sp. TaxID=1882829 RepID=UPI0025CCE8EA|nr:hypothetical protein [Vallitalea sp.]MCT4687575.1 apolipoprotein A1/A4/E family protein [Vallitalea sp.]